MKDKWIVHDFDQAPERSPRSAGRRSPQLQRTRPERRAFHGALAVSVLLHALLLSQLVSGDGQGLPGFVLPWQERRIAVPDVQVVLAPLPEAPAPPASAVSVQRASIRSVPVEVPARPPAVPPAPVPVLAPAPAPAPAPRPAAVEAVPVPVPPVPQPARVDVPVPTLPPPPPSPAPVLAVPVVPVAPSPAPTAVAPALPVPVPVPVAVTPVIPVEASASNSSPDAVALAAREAAQEALRQETLRAEVERQEAARQAAAQLDAQRQEAARQTAARAEAARAEAARAETARLEAERQQAARQAAAQLEAQRQETARQVAAQQEAVRAQAAQTAQAAQAVQEAAAKREALLRAIGRQLDEENARRDASANTARPPGTLPLSLNTARRARLWGHTDTNAELVAYAQAWALKLQLNTLPDKVREVTRRPHTPPTVTVALRSDGSVESVAFVVSSGVPEVDEAIRRMVETQRPYPAFPPALAREFDVVEIRRTWYFDAAVRLH